MKSCEKCEFVVESEMDIHRHSSGSFSHKEIVFECWRYPTTVQKDRRQYCGEFKEKQDEKKQK